MAFAVRVRLRFEAGVKSFDPFRPVGHDGIFDAGSGDPARLSGRGGGGEAGAAEHGRHSQLAASYPCTPQG